MSGGSFDYLYLKDAPCPEELDRMADAISRIVPFSRAEEKTRELASAIRANSEDETLRQAWRAVEWFHSADYGEDQAAEAIRKVELGPRSSRSKEAAERSEGQ